ncbi:translation initiation factor eIF3 subunit g [Boothiomyces macroporosus]|uniref:Eukaryotic translation initiation factor 3 subunit G n=1 Tax=Boothiomyces macroporosus TaxID=261099 RepID=A0AAD5UPL3_9FUNG|nr:translation initiation factor eIF3 subunit g [Boothiomyces macroporosus]KAJ3314152.1 translation initiation factor eIF3 subunit g [Boothiomyces sp. JEL0838]
MPAHNWSDDVDENGIKTVTEIKTNENGEKVKVTKKIQLKTQTKQVNHAVAERRKWKKFGACKGFPSGPDSESTTIGERVMLKLSLNAKDLEEPEEDPTKKLSANAKIVCRICKGDHWTTKCPFKDTYQPSNEIAAKVEAKDVKGGNKYVPPSKRGGAGDKPAGRERDDSNSIRISNLSEETTDSDVRELLRKCGPTQRVFVAKDHSTGLCKGYAFITFFSQDAAEHAIKSLNGYGFDNLILKVDWAQRDRN